MNKTLQKELSIEEVLNNHEDLIEAKIQKLLGMKPEVIINKNDNIGEELYTVELINEDKKEYSIGSFWLNAFKTYQEAVKFIKQYNLRLIRIK